MNGMTRKKLLRARKKMLTDDGLPRDPKDWTEADWRTLHTHLEAIKREIAERHRTKKGTP